MQACGKVWGSLECARKSCVHTVFFVLNVGRRNKSDMNCQIERGVMMAWLLVVCKGAKVTDDSLGKGTTIIMGEGEGRCHGTRIPFSTVLFSTGSYASCRNPPFISKLQGPFTTVAPAEVRTTNGEGECLCNHSPHDDACPHYPRASSNSPSSASSRAPSHGCRPFPPSP